MTPISVSRPDRLARLRPAIEKTRLPLAQASQLPGELYCSEDIAALEKDRIFMKTWLCVGLCITLSGSCQRDCGKPKHR